MHPRGSLTTVLRAYATLFLLAVSTPAQTLKGTILGTVTDQSHAVVPAVAVKLTEVNTNFQRAEATNDSGFFAFANLDPGTYRIEVEHPGFRKVVRAGLALDANTTVRADVELAPGDVTQVVDVTSEAPVLQTDRADTGGKIQNQQLSSLPMLNNRNYQNTLMLVPGVMQAFRSNSPFFNSQEHLQSVVNGLNQKNNYMIEGIDNNIEATNNLTAIVLPADAISTVDVSTTNYDPELGRAGGGVVNVIMKSGTNRFHGSLFEYHRDNDLQDRNFFATAVPHSVYNQYGGSFGGRIKRDKLFFFADFQGSRDLGGQFAIPTIPTMDMRAGNFAASPTTVYDPATGNQATGTGRTPFPNQTIPAARISPITVQYLSFLPPPTGPGLAQNFQEATNQAKSIAQTDFKIDYLINSTNKMFFRYSYQQATVTNPGLYGPGLGIYGGPSNNGFDATGPSRNQSPGINFSHIVSPTLITEVRFGIVRNRNDATNVDTGLTLTQKLGIPNGNLGDVWTSGLAEIFVNGYDTPMIGVNGCLPWRRATTNFEAANNWTKIKGTHVIKWGFDMSRQRYDLLQTSTYSPRGRFTFAPGPTTLNGGPANSFANSFAAFLLDQPNSVGRDLAVYFPTNRKSVYNAYFQDKWQVTQKLTLDLGARWEYWPADVPEFPVGFSGYIPSNNTLVLAGMGSTPLNLGIKNYPHNIYPRIGFAYRLDEKTVVRGGFGMSSFYRYTNNTQNAQYPVAQQQQLLASNSFVAAGSMAAGFPAPAPVVIPSNGIVTNAPNQSYSVLIPYVPVPYIETWNVAVQRSLPSNLSLEAAFVGNHGVDTSGGTVNVNAATTAGTGSSSEPLNILFGRTASTTYPWYQSSYYDALQAKLNRRFSNGFSMTTSYAFSKSLDYSTTNALGYVTYKARSAYDRRHLLTWSAIYELPFGRGKSLAANGVGRALLGGWQINGLWTWESGVPLNITASSTSLNASGNSQRPNLVGQAQVLGQVGPGKYWFTPSAFANPPAGTIGNVGRDILAGPHLFNINASVFRKFNLTERLKMEFRAETYNLSNTKWLDSPDTTLGDAAFGQVTTAQGNQSVKTNMNRSFQGSLRLTF